MNIYLLKQTENNDYDTYDSFVCYAETEEDAKQMHPRFGTEIARGPKEEPVDIFSYVYVDMHWTDPRYIDSEWALPEFVTAELIGISDTTEPGVILASYNAG